MGTGSYILKNIGKCWQEEKGILAFLEEGSGEQSLVGGNAGDVMGLTESLDNLKLGLDGVQQKIILMK